MMPSSSSSSLIRSSLTNVAQTSLVILFLCHVLFQNCYYVNGLFIAGDPKVIDSQLLTEKIVANQTIRVNVNGEGSDFKSIQAAIDSVPEGNSNWIIIHVRKGIYKENVHIPRNKPYIFMRGDGKGKTSIIWTESSHNKFQSATFKVQAQNFIAFGISFKNEGPNGVANAAHVAAFVGGDKIAFYDCGFFSTHNTLFDYKGRHYYHNCYIQGSVDLIFGRARSIYDKCEIFVVGDRRVDIHGSIAAHSRKSAGENSGFVFVKGKIYGVGNGNVYLGRAKDAFSRVIFANTYLSRSIVPQGWTNWSYAGSTNHVHHAEYNCHGPGSTPKDRAPWSKQLSDKEVAPFISLDFIHGKHWLPAASL
ncbi:OLC1v1020514C1 [Oldenlandia corymbosa var. corymbosa]|uniref:pectinesterase n=1 Tax=Oldenlandia corymbosa var. corymbosa TaxID=529605 RepID=A0AAV1EGN2_OLDCO|nr:OLC1v1020514C1 [Oldenlandia corymbosa var. corymbosa]